MSYRILITAERDVAAPFLKKAEGETDLLHLPLELTGYSVDPEETQALIKTLDRFSFILHENLRDARFFMQWVNNHKLLDQVQNLVNLTLDQPTADFLEVEKVPAICPKAEARPIDLLEFLLRISRDGYSLCPVHSGKTSELPGLLQELDLPVSEFSVCSEKTIPTETLELYREKIEKESFDTVLIHNRSALVRIQTAFPDLNLQELNIISGSAGLTELLRKEGIEPVRQGNGTWYSIADAVLSSEVG
ncbi:MAG: hypothetical protein JJU46_02095 [Balneolaceae bacterium]|nr:hypothetical protein [Balneolaceae bacterium]MCH8547471.1 hypothetical protein [Balneolaceae bacterium]